MRLIVNHFVFFPQLSKAAMSMDNHDGGLRYWYHLGAAIFFDPRCYSTTEVRDFLMAHTGISRSSAYAVLKRGEGLFWEIKRGGLNVGPGRFRLFSPKEVAKALGVIGFDIDLSTIIDLEVFAYPGYRKFLWQAARKLVSKGAPPLTRGHLTAVTGFKCRSQQKYDKALGEVRVPNWMVMDTFRSLDDAHHAYSEGLDAGTYDYYTFRVMKTTVTVGSGDTRTIIGIFRRVGNTYVRDQEAPSSSCSLFLYGTQGKIGFWFTRQSKSIHAVTAGVVHDIQQEWKPPAWGSDGLRRQCVRRKAA